jgi:hypothetical protein
MRLVYNLAVTLSLLTAYAPSGNSQVLTYSLLPGATITPMDGSAITGPTESLTGTFQWYAVSDPFNVGEFDLVSLDFYSDSFHLTLQQPNEYEPFINPPSVFFNADVDITGLSIPTGQMDCYMADGTYSGAMEAPDSLTFPDVRISPVGGGNWAAQLTFSAEQIPEPSVTTLLCACAALLITRERRSIT